MRVVNGRGVAGGVRDDNRSLVADLCPMIFMGDVALSHVPAQIMREGALLRAGLGDGEERAGDRVPGACPSRD